MIPGYTASMAEPQQSEPAKVELQPTFVPTSVMSQTMQTIVGEITGSILAIGAVYIAERGCPKHTEAFIESLAHKIGQWRGLPAHTQQKLAKEITDFGVMNLGSGANLAVQLGMRWGTRKPEEERSFAYEVPRLAVGRIGGTITAAGGLALAKTFAPRLMEGSASPAVRLFGGGLTAQWLGKQVMSNLVQSAAALPGNVPAQLLFDHLLGRDKQQAQTNS
jgi:hypothetical protein